MNETRRIALRFALDFGVKDSSSLIILARYIEAFLTDDDKFLEFILNPDSTPTEARP